MSDLAYLKDYQAMDGHVRTSAAYESALPPRGRTTPSGAVAWVWEKLKNRRIFARTAVDIGCGKGRNSLFLARKGFSVTSMDVTPDAIAALREEAEQKGLGSKIRAFLQDVAEDWPIERRSCDLAIDAFCFRHLASKEACQAYKNNLLRVLSPRGRYLLSLAGIGDGYYGTYMRRPGQPRAPVDDAVKIDPGSVESPIYSRRAIIAFFAPELKVCAELESRDPSDRAKDDGTYALLFRRSPKWFYTY